MYQPESKSDNFLNPTFNKFVSKSSQLNYTYDRRLCASKGKKEMIPHKILHKFRDLIIGNFNAFSSEVQK